MGCKNICSRYKAQKPHGMGRYAAGQRRCQICEIFIAVEGLWCPCCGYRLRTKPRNLYFKAKLRSRSSGEPVQTKGFVMKTSRNLQKEHKEKRESEKWLHDCPKVQMTLSLVDNSCPHCKKRRPRVKVVKNE